MRRNWEEVARDGTKAQWAGIYVTLNGKGSLVMNRAAYQKMGEPKAFLILFDPANATIGLKPTALQIKNAYPALKSGPHGGRRVNAYRLLTERALHIKETLEFPDAEIDEDGVLILSLRTAKVSNRATNHPSRRAKNVV